MPRLVDLPMPNTYLRLMLRATGAAERVLAGTGLTVAALAQDGFITVGQ